MKNKKILSLSVFLVVILFGVYLLKPQKQVTPPQDKPSSIITVSPTQNLLSDKFEYQGQEGVDALTLLKQKTTVDQDSSGMVISISDRQADNNQREFWSFYINGEPAQVGAASYITKNNDIISWKIEKY